jgi:Fe-S oxidoreductase
MGRRKVIPPFKRLAISVLGGADRIIFRVMRALGLSRRASAHHSRGRSPLRFLYPLLGWPTRRMLPLPSGKPFIDSHPRYADASRFDGALERLKPEEVKGAFDAGAAARLLEKIRKARQENIGGNRSACFFVGDAVNQFFPGEGADVVFVLNILGIDVRVPDDQTCCFAPALYAGDIRRARRGAERLVTRLARYDFDWLVTSCSSGGLMLKEEYPVLLGLSGNGYSGVDYDEKEDLFRQKGGGTASEGGESYRDRIAGRIRDINELVAEMLGYEPAAPGYESLFSEEPEQSPSGEDNREEIPGDFPVVVYHHPCHLNRGQRISGEPEYILRALPGFRFREMEDADTCCGGGGLFTFAEPEISARVGSEKVVAIAEAGPDVVATSCPLCRIQISDMLQRDYPEELALNAGRLKDIEVVTPVQLLARDLRRMLQA